MRIVVTGGGTGGHVYAALSIASACRRQFSSEVLFIGSSHGPEVEAVRETGINFEGVKVSGIAGKRISSKARGAVYFIKGTGQCRRILKEFDPFCVIGTGGYVSAPACYAASILKIPFILNEMNYDPGIVTKWLSGRAYRVALAYEETAAALSSKARTALTGIPVREWIEALQDDEIRSKMKEEALREYGLEPERKTLFIFGGSQGAQAINNAVWKNVLHFSERDDIQILHITGDRGYNDGQLKPFIKDAGKGKILYRVLRYANRIELAYAVCDLAVTRGGAGTLAELSVARIPSIIIPFPYSAGGHQENNAKVLVDAGSALMIKQSGDDAGGAIKEAINLLVDMPRLSAMRKSAEGVYLGNGSKGIIELLDGLLSEK